MFWAEPANIGTFAIRATVTRRLPGRACAILRGLRVSGIIPPKADPVLSPRAVFRGLRGSVLSPRWRFRYSPPEKALRATRFRYCPPLGGSGIVSSNKQAPRATWFRYCQLVWLLLLLLLLFLLPLTCLLFFEFVFSFSSTTRRIVPQAIVGGARIRIIAHAPGVSTASPT